ncbi:hypothetical protein [Halofilum ochraceum]|uniref:hypothetical protein n=1 Tax=Halofilum ochraceum TaxID=1611323 RepID=UPI001C30475E|nr:hypothetical protein [Halofilum ochraceum]
MSISWGNWAVRVYATKSWVALAQRFAVDHPMIIEHLEIALKDPVPAVRLQVAENLQVLYAAAPERMWKLAEQIATHEPDPRILAFCLSRSIRRFSYREPERCEVVLSTVKERLDNNIPVDEEARYLVLESLGGWTAQLYVCQGRGLTWTWLQEWATNPGCYRDLLDSFTSSLRKAMFDRYRVGSDAQSEAVSNRAQEGLALILTHASRILTEAHGVLKSDAPETEKEEATERYIAAEKVIHHAMNQIYFGSGANASDPSDEAGLGSTTAMARFLDDYADILELLGTTREPITLHYLIELYEFVIPGDPVRVFDAVYALLLGRGEEEGYQYESLGQKKVVGMVERFIADHRGMFEDEARRAKLVAILRLFADVGWPDSLRLLYDLPDLLR